MATKNVSAEVLAERARCARIAERRAKDDENAYVHETNWDQPYAANRVIRASLDIAAIIPRRGDQ